MAISNTYVNMTKISSEFGGNTPDSLSEYYEGGGRVLSNAVQPNGIPKSGPISFGDFRGAGPYVDPVINFTVTVGKPPPGSNAYWNSQSGVNYVGGQHGFHSSSIGNGEGNFGNGSWGGISGTSNILVAQSFQWNYSAKQAWASGVVGRRALGAWPGYDSQGRALDSFNICILASHPFGVRDYRIVVYFGGVTFDSLYAEVDATTYGSRSSGRFIVDTSGRKVRSIQWGKSVNRFSWTNTSGRGDAERRIVGPWESGDKLNFCSVRSA